MRARQFFILRFFGVAVLLHIVFLLPLHADAGEFFDSSTTSLLVKESTWGSVNDIDQIFGKDLAINLPFEANWKVDEKGQTKRPLDNIEQIEIGDLIFNLYFLDTNEGDSIFWVMSKGALISYKQVHAEGPIFSDLGKNNTKEHSLFIYRNSGKNQLFLLLFGYSSPSMRLLLINPNGEITDEVVANGNKSSFEMLSEDRQQLELITLGGTKIKSHFNDVINPAASQENIQNFINFLNNYDIDSNIKNLLKVSLNNQFFPEIYSLRADGVFVPLEGAKRRDFYHKYAKETFKQLDKNSDLDNDLLSLLILVREIGEANDRKMAQELKKEPSNSLNKKLDLMVQFWEVLGYEKLMNIFH